MNTDDLTLRNPHMILRVNIEEATVYRAAPEMLTLLKDLYEHGYTTTGDHARVAAMIAKAEGH